ncbi:TPA: hypothetical protein ACTXAM_005267 [Raoultella ornithinolytica]|uniref:hypothetical protein n=1 Tax=Klebsiella michiganensis TaxID=1134687 RepID=UPI0015E56AED|nr:hypothetical protein [Klebsiella michiganensis]QLP50941.1 hypothetical protein HV105_29875 [Klebsiella michiganensis]HBZ0992952.1 hypothetical protein [Klebsiella pneumoniae]
MNYNAFGEFTAFGRQARDAAARRFSLLHDLIVELEQLAEIPQTVIDENKIKLVVSEIAMADREMRTALNRANESADLCGEARISLSELKAK